MALPGLQTDVFGSHWNHFRGDSPSAPRLGLRVLESMQPKKGSRALQFSREMEITHKSALFVLRRIRHGLGGERAEADWHH